MMTLLDRSDEGTNIYLCVGEQKCDLTIDLLVKVVACINTIPSCVVKQTKLSVRNLHVGFLSHIENHQLTS